MCSQPAYRRDNPGTQESLNRPDGDDWVALSSDPLPVDEAIQWATIAACGAVVSFIGTVRDHAEGRPGVTELEYEAYASQVEPRLAAIAHEARRLWPGVGRLAIWHRTGKLAVKECSVVVVASAAHRAEAFEVARYCIDTVKQTVPIWKRETWSGGRDWSTCAHDVVEVGE
jgi:molybdopterin synthase catalytic subunit